MNKEKIIKIFLGAPRFLMGVLLFVIIWSYVSNTFDPDLGWHLRFGKDAIAGNFQYQDSYTWPYFGQNFINHEWGGDILFWLIYSNFGYYALVVLVSVAFFFSFYLVIKSFRNEVNFTGFLVSAIIFTIIKYLVVMRLAFLGTFFFVVVLYSLEKINNKKYLWLWPALFWIWAAVHGSWALGFVVINIYIAGNLLQDILSRHFAFILPSTWKKSDYKRVIISEILALFAVGINPYGFKMHAEVFAIITEADYKQYITEWMPAIAYPVYWQSLLTSVLIVFFALITFFKKKLSFTHLIVFGAFFLSGVLYRRNAFYILLIGIPLLNEIFVYVGNEVASKVKLIRNFAKNTKIRFFSVGLVLVLLGGFLIVNINKISIYSDIWNQGAILKKHKLPYEALRFLKNKVQPGDKIFGEANWTGYLEWVAPGGLYYLDGRSVVTWKNPTNPKQSFLRKYIEVLLEKGGYEELMKNNVKYIFLQNKNFIRLSKPDFVNRFIFGKTLNKNFIPVETLLEKKIRKDKSWQLIYTDDMVNIWEKLDK